MKGRGWGNLTRRDFFQGSAAMLAMATVGGKCFAAEASGASSNISPIMMTLSSYMSDAANRKLPDAVVEKTKFMILDTIAAMLSGSELPSGRFAIQFARAYPGERMATVVGSNLLCGPIEAAMVNGMLAQSGETDDTHPPSYSHPGCSIVPTALVAGERFSIDGTRFMRAVALGYDIGPRVTATLGKMQYMAATHRSTHAIAGTFGSAAAAGCVANLNAQQMRWLLSYAAQQAGGLASWQRDTEHIEKSFDFGGMPARNGVTAALLVQAGGTGVDDVLSGADNFFQGFVPMNDPAMLIDKLGERYEIMRTDVKRWVVGSPIQAPVDALDNLLRNNRFEPDEVKQIVVRVGTHDAMLVDNREIPTVCLQHLIAVMLIDKTISFKSAHDGMRMRDPAVLRQRAKVKLVLDDELERLMPKRVAVVELTMVDGRTLTERVEAVRGTAANPMTREEIIAKCRDLIAPVTGEAACQKLIDKVFALESVKSILELRPLLQKA